MHLLAKLASDRLGCSLLTATLLVFLHCVCVCLFIGVDVFLQVQNEFRIPADQGIAGHVATTGQILNIKDAYSHPLFYRGVDDSTGFKTRNILCFPIKDENNGNNDLSSFFFHLFLRQEGDY